MEPFPKTDNHDEPPVGDLDLQRQRLIDNIALLVVRQFRRNSLADTPSKGAGKAHQYKPVSAR